MASNASKQTLFALALGLFCSACFGEEFTTASPGTPGGAGGTGGQGTGGDAGAGGRGGGGGATGGSGAGGAPIVCPTDLEGPTMVPIEVPGGGSYCIDSTEVTVGQYRKFYLFAQANPPTQPVFCNVNMNFYPLDFETPKPDGFPQASIDWCDARGYCEWAGKRLCGKIGGGPLDIGDVGDAQQSEWLHACSARGTRKYPYGNAYNSQACNGLEHPPNAPDGAIPTGMAEACEGGMDGLFDMSGNVAEFIQSCDDGERCRAAASKFNSDATEMECARVIDPIREEKFEYLGFRCCGN